MNFTHIAIVALSAAWLNILIFYLFKKYLIGTSNPAMKFLMINIIKDLVWVGFSLILLEHTRNNFLLVIAAFLLTSFFLYYKVIVLINRR